MEKEISTPMMLSERHREKLKQISKKEMGKKNMNAAVRFLIEKYDII